MDCSLPKVLLLGYSKVGKSNILKEFFEGKFSNCYKPTIGLDYYTFDKENNKFKIWEKGGLYNIDFNVEHKMNILVFVYFRNDKQSFDYIKKIIPNYNSNNVVKILVENGYDIECDNICPSECEVIDFINQNKLIGWQVSAKESYNIKELFNYISICVKNLKT